MKLKNRQIVDIYNFIETMKGVNVVKPKGYIYKSAKNKKILQTEIDSLQEIEPKLRSEYNNSQTEIRRKYVKREGELPVLKDGSLAQEGQNVLFSDVQFENIEGMNKELTEFANKTNFEAMKKEEEEFNEVLEREVEVDLVVYEEQDMWDGINEVGFGMLVDIGLWEL